MKLISTKVKRRQWWWIGHVLRMEKEEIPCTALAWAPEGKRKRGRLKETRRCTVEKELQELGLRSRAEASTVCRIKINGGS